MTLTSDGLSNVVERQKALRGKLSRFYCVIRMVVVVILTGIQNQAVSSLAHATALRSITLERTPSH